MNLRHLGESLIPTGEQSGLRTLIAATESNGVPVSPEDRQILDTVNIPFWSGTGPYPSVTLRMDFRGPDIGDFVYHCHILDHEDGGMMAIIRVLPQDKASTSKSSRPKGPVQASRGVAAGVR